MFGLNFNAYYKLLEELDASSKLAQTTNRLEDLDRFYNKVLDACIKYPEHPGLGQVRRIAEELNDEENRKYAGLDTIIRDETRRWNERKRRR